MERLCDQPLQVAFSISTSVETRDCALKSSTKPKIQGSKEYLYEES